MSENINYELIIIENKNLGFYYNKIVEKMKKKNFIYFFMFNDDDIYKKYYLEENILHIKKNPESIICKNNVPIFINIYNSFYILKENSTCSKYKELIKRNTISFNINNISHKFNTETKEDINFIFLKEFIEKEGNIYYTSCNNHIFIINTNYPKYDIKNYILDLQKIIDPMLINNLYSNLLFYKFIDVSHLLVTVIITMYNSSETIKTALQSIISQSHQNLEIIVVDDCSNDKSVEIVENFINNNNNIRLIKNSINRGTYYCKNLALKILNKNTKYIAFQDSDDYSHKERIRKQIEVLNMNNGKLSITLCKRYNVLRFACISQIYDIEIFHKLGYFDNSRFGADSEYLYRFMKIYNLKMKGNYNYLKNDSSIFKNISNIHYCIPCQLYYIIRNNEQCLSNISSLNSKIRLDYKNKFKKRIKNLKNLYYYPFV